jgi:hypothetical protein
MGGVWREKHTMINLTQSGARCFAKAKLFATMCKINGLAKGDSDKPLIRISLWRRRCRS